MKRNVRRWIFVFKCRVLRFIGRFKSLNDCRMWQNVAVPPTKPRLNSTAESCKWFSWRSGPPQVSKQPNSTWLLVTVVVPLPAEASCSHWQNFPANRIILQLSAQRLLRPWQFSQPSYGMNDQLWPLVYQSLHHFECVIHVKCDLITSRPIVAY